LSCTTIAFLKEYCRGGTGSSAKLCRKGRKGLEGLIDERLEARIGQKGTCLVRRYDLSISLRHFVPNCVQGFYKDGKILDVKAPVAAPIRNGQGASDNLAL